MAVETTVDVVDVDVAFRTEVLKDLRAGGFRARGYAPEDFPAALRAGPPQLVLARGEPGAPTIDRMLGQLASHGCRWVPLVVVAQDDTERSYAQGFRTGVVDVWKAAARGTFPARLRALLAALPERGDGWKGAGDGRLLTAFLAHARKTLRTGQLSVKDKRGEEGQVSIVDGQVRSASYQGRAWQDALKALGALGQATLSFAQPHHAPEPAAVVALEPPSAPPPPPAPLSVRPAPPPLAAEAPEPIVAGSIEELPPEEPDPFAVRAPLSGEAQPSGVPAPAVPVDSLGEDPFQPLERSRAGEPDAGALDWRVPAPAPEAPDAPDAPDALEAPATPELVLLVDDDADLRRLFSAFFTKRGYRVQVAQDGTEVLAAATTELPGLVLADLNMPRLDGWALLRLLREDVRTREVPVALFSCHDEYRESLRAAQAGAQAFFPKTMRLDTLEKKIRELLAPRAQFRQAVASGRAEAPDLAALGPAWVLRTLGALGFTGALEATDTWTRIRVELTGGLLGEITATVGSHSARGDAALQALVAVKRAQGALTFDPPPPSERPEQVADALARVLGVLAAQQAHVRAATLRQARGFEVNQQLYALYLGVGPPRLREATRALCEARLHPREVAEQSGLSLADLEALVLDLVRRGVVTLR